MKTYRKGYRLENWLVNQLKSKGFFVIRSAKSGNIDIVALKKPFVLGFECKSINGNYLSIPEHELKALERFNDEGMSFVVVKLNRQGVYVLNPQKNYTIKEIKSKGIKFEKFLIPI